MSPLYEHENFGDVQRYVFMKGIITDVDYENDTADVTIPGGSDGTDVPIFYHCSDEAEERSNGAIEGGSVVFKNGTEVIVMCTVDNEAVRIIGFVDGIKSCGIIVELISAGKSYYNTYTIGTDEIVGGDEFLEYDNPYDVFSSYFSFRPNSPDGDITEESCVCVVPGETENTVSNVAADNFFSSALDHRDDWHRIDFTWVGFPYWLATSFVLTRYLSNLWGMELLNHPGIGAGVSGYYYHLSHSDLTYGSLSHEHIIRHIDQEKRLYRPGLINLPENESDPETPTYLMTEAGFVRNKVYKMSPYGKKPFTRNTTSGDVSTYNERMAISGAGDYTITAGGYNLVMFFWPFIPYMWEIPNFNLFSFHNTDPIYGRSITPEAGAYVRAWNYKADSVRGGEIDIPSHSDTVTLTKGPSSSTSTSDTRPHIAWVDGWIAFVGDVNDTWVDTASSSSSYSAEVEKTVPIGSVCNGMSLSVMNSMSLTSSTAYDEVTSTAKSTNLGTGTYLWPPSYPGWWGLGSHTDHTVTTGNIDEYRTTTSSLESELKFGNTIIESGSGSMTYDYSWNEHFVVDNTFSINVTEHRLPDRPNAYSKSTTGTRTDTTGGTGNMARDIVTFAVLDYDSESIFQYGDSLVHAVAVVYKKITITHAIDVTLARDDSWDTNGELLSTIIENGGFRNAPVRHFGPSNSTSTTTRSGIRTVEYKVYANIGGTIYSKTLSTVTVTQTELEQSVEGDRIYGVVCKLQNSSLVLTYDVDEFVTTANAHVRNGAYDSPFNFEDWNVCDEVYLWSTKNRVVGIVYLGTDGFGKELYDEKDPLPSEIYSASFNNG
jgi:hypothetical protein